MKKQIKKADPEKVYTLKLTEKELRNAQVKNALVKLIASRVITQKSKRYITVSPVEVIILKKHYSWADVSLYAPKVADRMKGEVGKFNGKRCVLRGGRL